MLINKKSLQVVKAASKDEMRHSICGVRINADGSTEATDGHVLVQFKPVNLPSLANYPTIEGIQSEQGKHRPATITTDAVKKLLAAAPKCKHLPSIDGNMIIDTQYSNGLLKVGVSDISTDQILKVEKIDGEFPQTENVIPTGKAKFTIGLGLPALKTLISTLDALGAHCLKFEFTDELAPTKITGKTTNGKFEKGNQDGEILAVIMPMRLK